MVYVVYGNPPSEFRNTTWTTTTNDYDRRRRGHDNDVTIPTVTAADKAVFQKMYDDLAAESRSMGLNRTREPPTCRRPIPQALLTRHGVKTVDTGRRNHDEGDLDDNDAVDGITAKAIVHALANEIFDPPTEIRHNDPLAGRDGTVDR